MQLESKKLLEDVRLACERILEFTKDKTLSDYTFNDLISEMQILFFCTSIRPTPPQRE